MNEKQILNDLLAEAKQIAGVRCAEMKMRFMHVTCEQPDYCIVATTNNSALNDRMIAKKLDKLIRKYNEKYGLIEQGVYVFFQIA